MKAVEAIEGIVTSNISKIKTIIAIVKLETQLAGLSIIPLVLNLFMLSAVCISTWGLVNLLAGVLLVKVLGHQWVLIIGLLSVINVGVCLILIKYLAFNLKGISFEKTRALLSAEKVEHK